MIKLKFPGQYIHGHACNSFHILQREKLFEAFFHNADVLRNHDGCSFKNEKMEEKAEGIDYWPATYGQQQVESNALPDATNVLPKLAGRMGFSIQKIGLSIHGRKKAGGPPGRRTEMNAL